MSDEKNIFKVEINEKGAESIRRIYSLVKIVFWTSLAIHLITCGYIIYRSSIFTILRRNRQDLFTYRLFIYPGYLLLLALSTFFYYYYFLRFSRRIKASLELNDSLTFNESFRWIYKGLLFGLVSILIHGAFMFYTFYAYRI